MKISVHVHVLLTGYIIQNSFPGQHLVFLYNISLQMQKVCTNWVNSNKKKVERKATGGGSNAKHLTLVKDFAFAFAFSPLHVGPASLTF